MASGQERLCLLSSHKRMEVAISDRFGIAVVILLRLHVRLNTWWAQSLCVTAYIMRATARLHRRRVSWQLIQEWFDAATRNAPPQNHSFRFIKSDTLPVAQRRQGHPVIIIQACS